MASLSPVEIIAQILRVEFADTAYKNHVYIGRAPENQSAFISVCRGQSQGLLYGFGKLALRYTTVDIRCRADTYGLLEEVLCEVLDVLTSLCGFWISGISPAQPIREGLNESMELSLTGEFLDVAKKE